MSGTLVGAHHRVFTALGRLLGVGFVIVGGWGLVTLGRQASEERGIGVVLSLSSLSAGIGLLVAQARHAGGSNRVFGWLRKRSNWPPSVE